MNVSMMRLGYSPRIFEIKSDPIQSQFRHRESGTVGNLGGSRSPPPPSYNIQHRDNELGTLGVVLLRPVVARASLFEHKVVPPEQLSERSRTNAVHGSRVEVHENRAGHVATTGGLIGVHLDALQLEVRVAVERARRVDAVLVRDDLPEPGSDLIAALGCGRARAWL